MKFSSEYTEYPSHPPFLATFTLCCFVFDYFSSPSASPSLSLFLSFSPRTSAPFFSDQPTGRLALVFELMECNIYELIKGKKVHRPEATVKSYTYQLMKAVEHMHRNGIFHRDIKPENLLVADALLKLADFGSCRGIHSKKPYTEYISTRWYRAPECLLTDGYYGSEMDIWGIGCVMFETLALFPLFPGSNEADQIERIHKVGMPLFEGGGEGGRNALASCRNEKGQHSAV